MRESRAKAVLCLKASSPEELADALALGQQDNSARGSFVALNIYGPQVLVRHFDLPRLSLTELRRALLLEAAELLHLKVEEVELDYQLYYDSENKSRGVFCAVPKVLLEEYLACCDKAAVILLRMTPNIIAVVDLFLQNIDVNNDGDFCFFDFSLKDTVYLAVFSDKECILLREIRYENLNDAEQEAMNSLKYCCARSVTKQFTQGYSSGDLSGKDELVRHLEKEFNISIQPINFTDTTGVLPAKGESFSRINLVKRYAVSLALRNGILALENTIIAICILACLTLGLKVINNALLVSKARSFLKTSDYGYAQSISAKLKSLQHAK